jgi:signal transduction histidine kinase
MGDTAPPDARLAKLVHDLRSPLTVAEGFAQLLARDDGRLTPEQRADFAGRVASAMADMRALLDAAR